MGSWRVESKIVETKVAAILLAARAVTAILGLEKVPVSLAGRSKTRTNAVCN